MVNLSHLYPKGAHHPQVDVLSNENDDVLIFDVPNSPYSKHFGGRTSDF